MTDLRPEDLRIDTFRSGAVNLVDSHVRITHIPSGISAESNYYTSQLRNKDEALTLLRHRLAACEWGKKRVH